MYNSTTCVLIFQSLSFGQPRGARTLWSSCLLGALLFNRGIFFLDDFDGLLCICRRGQFPFFLGRVAAFRVGLIIVGDLGLRKCLSRDCSQKGFVHLELLDFPKCLKDIFSNVHEIALAEMFAGESTLVGSSKGCLKSKHEGDPQLVKHGNSSC